MKLPSFSPPAGTLKSWKPLCFTVRTRSYLAGKSFGMRSAADNFTDEELSRAVQYAHERKKRVYVTVNTMPRTSEYAVLERYLRYLGEIGADAVIVSDIGVFMLARRVCPDTEIHVSTQASAVSAADCHRMARSRREASGARPRAYPGRHTGDTPRRSG